MSKNMVFALTWQARWRVIPDPHTLRHTFDISARGIEDGIPRLLSQLPVHSATGGGLQMLHITVDLINIKTLGYSNLWTLDARKVS